MAEKKVLIRNRAGIHCRPASVILNAINTNYPDTKFSIVSEGHFPVELNSILSLISLGLHHGNEALLKAEGPNAEEACEKIAELFETEFDFPPK